MENPAILKTEYHCECGRKYIIPGYNQGEPKKCPHCGRLIYPLENKEELEELFAKKQRPKNPITGLEDTLEYEYRFNEQGQRQIIETEPFSFKQVLRKFFALFLWGRSSRRSF